MQRYGSTSMRPNGGWSSSGTQNMQASIGQYSMQAGEPAQPVQQSVVIASIRGRFLRAALPSPSDIGQCFSTMSYILFVCNTRFCKVGGQHLKRPPLNASITKPTLT